jgi:gliding motility-associated-like protein
MFLQVSAQAQDTLELNIQSKTAEKGSKICLDVTVRNFKDIESFQFNLSYNATLIVPECPITYIHPLIRNNIFGDITNCATKQNGYLNLVWAGDPAIIPDNEVIFTLCFDLIGNPGNQSVIYFNGLLLQIEVCKSVNGKVTCLNHINSNTGTIKIVSNTLNVIPNKCDTDGTNSNGSLTFYASGGTAPFTYTINTNEFSGAIPIVGQRINLTNLPKKRYNISVTDALGVRKDTFVIISDNIPITYRKVATDPTCSTFNNGKISLENMDGGIKPYQIEWSNYVSGIGLSSISGLESGRYYVTVTDADGCSKFDSTTLKTIPIVFNHRVSRDASCKQRDVKDGSIELTVSGGVPWLNGHPYEYEVNSEGWKRFTPPFNVPDLKAGDYTIRVRDSLLCSTATFTGTIGAEKVLELKADKTDISCRGRKDGSAILSVSPTSSFYTYYSMPSFPDSLSNTTIDSLRLRNLPAGNYSYYVVDQRKCKDTVSFTISEPDSLKIVTTIEQPGCNTSGSIQITPSGGNAGYHYKWSPVAQDTNKISNLSGGIYTVTVSDARNCTINANFSLNSAGSLRITETYKSVSCAGKNDGSASVDVQFDGQIKMFDVIWRDANNVVLPPKTNTINNLKPGTYSFEVVAADGCRSVKKAFTITEPPKLSITADLKHAQCFGQNGSATIHVPGNPNSLIYEWKAAGNPAIIDNDSILNAKAGIYTFTVKQGTCSVDTTITINEPSKITFPIPETRNVSCFGMANGQAAIISPPTGLTFTWSTGTVAQFAVNFKAGPAWVVATNNSNNCVSDTTYFEVGTLPKLSVDRARSIIENPKCFGDSNGSIQIVPVGGSNTGFKYLWNDGATTATISNLKIGMYKVTIQDDKNCSLIDSVELKEPAKLEAVIDQSKTVELDCKNQIGGKIGLTTTGGNPGLKRITWQSGLVTDNGVAIGLLPGTYCATVTDNLGCKDTFCHTLISPPLLRGSVKNPAPPVCNGGTTCIGIQSVSGGTGNKYTFQINNGRRFPIDTCITVTAGQYFVSMIDSAGCSIDTIITINQPPPIEVNLGNNLNIQLGQPSEIIKVSVSTSLIDSVTWTPKTGIICSDDDCLAVVASPSETTTYTVIVTDLKGCKGSDQITVAVKNVRNVYFANAFTPNLDGKNDHFQAVIGPGVEKIVSFIIFDRWGNKVFEKYDYVPDPAGTDGWDGKFNNQKLNSGVFSYFAKARFIDGKEVDYSGSVTLIDNGR